MMRGLFAIVLLLSPLALAAPPAPTPWWETTTLDQDRDGLDDALALALRGQDPLVVLAAFDRVPTADDRAALQSAGFEIAQWYEHFDVVAVRTSPAAVARLLDVPHVVFVEANDVIVPLLRESVPLTGAPQVWKQYAATGKGQVIAVLDDGAFEQHPDFDGKVAASFDAGLSGPVGPFTLPASTPVVPAGDDGHGTHVAGTIVGPGTQSSGAYKGVAPDARFVDVKVFRGPNQTNSDIVLRGLDWTLSNRERYDIRVASMSLGGRASDGKDALSRAVNVAVDKGLIVVAAAGNAGPGEETIASPGAAEKAITVGAVDKQKRIASYSSRGPTLDGRMKPDLVAPGSGITSTIPPTSTTTVRGFLGGSRDIYYGALSGTSMAAPHVSGVIALMLEVNPELGPSDIKRILLATAQDLGPKGVDPDTGYGFVNAIAAVQVANDPTLLESPQFAAILGTLPEPAKEDLFARAQVELERARRDGTLMLYGGVALAVGLAVILVVALASRRRR